MQAEYLSECDFWTRKMEEHLKAAGCEKKALTDANRELERAEVNTMN